ncbi:phosphoglycolate phosphatase [Pollutimonas harenae]|uniref:Phosphoglycolate phosphatase n=1 Tax=Pollutimonas harenae TaxID=657015 RepID=A0A853GPI2_9BURK|nr:phosphoglycolate phosphatase [Pollutimonas harenae]NYT84948.1 phosphoglycolate phosphatase [Pollutimonas harenae]TEA72660.1 phosphoglycolate phosphatase [Pollutimonas harenae]
MTLTAALFDLDGTLLDTIPDLSQAANAMRQDLGLATVPQATIASYVGKGTENLVMRTLANNPTGTIPSQDDIRQGLTLFNRHYHACNGDSAVLYPGALEGLQAFKDAGYKLAIVTNKPTEFTLPLLERSGIAAFFDCVVCGDTCEQKKPQPMPFLHACSLLGVQPGQALAIGDSINDALAARAAGIPVLAVPYGYNEGMDVRDLPVDDIVTSIAEAAHWAANRKTEYQEP